jgi:hypothetical protein
MDDQPDIEEIAQTLQFIENRDPASTSVSQYDRDHEILASLRDRVAPVVIQPRTEGSEEGRPAAIDLLDRIENAIDDNRAKRESAAHRSGS